MWTRSEGCRGGDTAPPLKEWSWCPAAGKAPPTSGVGGHALALQERLPESLSSPHAWDQSNRQPSAGHSAPRRVSPQWGLRVTARSRQTVPHVGAGGQGRGHCLGPSPSHPAPGGRGGRSSSTQRPCDAPVAMKQTREGERLAGWGPQGPASQLNGDLFDLILAK